MLSTNLLLLYKIFRNDSFLILLHCQGMYFSTVLNYLKQTEMEKHTLRRNLIAEVSPTLSYSPSLIALVPEPCHIYDLDLLYKTGV